jgi:sugar/nucleoside kinase (ribokinase family)
MIELFTIGHVLNEFIRFPDCTVGPVLGGPAAYSAIAASRLGVNAGIVTKIGTDMPKSLLRPFYEANVDTRGIKIEGNDSTTNFLIYDELGNKALRFLKKAPHILFNDIPKDYLDAKIIHVCPVLNEISTETIETLSGLRAILSIDLSGHARAASFGHLRARGAVK